MLHLLRRPEITGARQIGIYWSRPTEISLVELWKLYPAQCYFPRTEREGFKLHFHRVNHLESMKPGLGGIGEPAPTDPPALPWNDKDLILVPGLAFDVWGGRVGSGLGFYDRFLADKPCPFWGIGISDQVLDARLAQSDTDVRMHALCTEQGWNLARP